MRSEVVCILNRRRFPIEERDVSDGGTINVAHVVEGLLARGARVEVFTQREPQHPSVRAAGRMTVHYVDFEPSAAPDTFRRDFEEGASFSRGVARHPAFRPASYRCIHSHHWTSAIGLADVLPVSVRLIHTPHLLASEKALHLGLACPEDVKAVEGALLRRADAVVALSVAERAAISDGYGIRLERVQVIYNGVSDAFFAVPAMDNVSDGSNLRLVSTARLCRQKGIDVLLDAMEFLLGEGVEATLTVAGGSYNEIEYERQLRQRAEAEPLRGRVYFLGHVPHGKIAGILGNADLYVQPSRYESQGIAVLEAMATGRPVVVSDLAAVREFLVHGVNGVLVGTDRPRELARALMDLRRDAPARVALGREARGAAAAFTWPRTVADTLSIVWD